MCKKWKGLQKMIASMQSLLSLTKRGSSILENAAVYRRPVQSGENILEKAAVYVRPVQYRESMLAEAYPVVEARKEHGAESYGRNEEDEIT